MKIEKHFENISFETSQDTVVYIDQNLMVQVQLVNLRLEATKHFASYKKNTSQLWVCDFGE